MPRVIIPGVMQELTGGQGEIEVEGRSLREVFAQLVLRYPALKERLFDAQGSLHHYIALFVDGVEVRASQGLLAPVGEGAEIVIVPALSGGAGARA